MSRKKLFVLSKKDEKAVQLFAELGMPKNLAKTLMYLSHVDECYSADIEHGADLRQPEVCIAIKELRHRGWIKKRELNKEGKGRPVHIYMPTKNLSEILNVFEQEKLKGVETVENDISELKDLIEKK